MAEKVDFASLRNVKGGDVKPPVLVPTGHYRAMIVGPMSEHKARSGNVAMRFPIRLTEATDDVDAEALAEAGGLPDKSYNMDFWMSSDAQYRFTNFARSCGGIDVDNLTLIEIAEQLAENQVQFTIEAKHEPATDNNGNVDPDKPPFLRLDNPVGDEAA